VKEKMRRAVVEWLVLGALAIATISSAASARRITQAPPSGPVPTAKASNSAPDAHMPRLQQMMSHAAGEESEAEGISGGSGSRAGARARAGDEWWVKDPPWFLPPPPEWGPMPPTMYTSFFHRPRYPSLSTANYYPLYTRTDEYDAHLPASMSRRATYTQQMIYDNYVNTYLDHTKGSGFPAGDPNVGVSNPMLGSVSAQFGGMSEAHGRTLEAAAANRNNYFPMFSRSDDYHRSPNSHWPNSRMVGALLNPGGGDGYVNSMAFIESAAQARALQHHSAQYGDRAVTYFASSTIPRFKPRSADVESESEEADD